VVVNDLPVFRETIGGIATISDIENFEEAFFRTLNNKRSREELMNFSKKYSPKNEIDSLIKVYNESL
jgi:glycosyltransferase involved in cell wall biosynthesis